MNILNSQTFFQNFPPGVMVHSARSIAMEVLKDFKADSDVPNQLPVEEGST